MDEVANPNPNPNPEPNPNPNPNPNPKPKPRPAAARPPARACRPVRLGAQAGCYYGPEVGRRSCKRERHDLQVPINTPHGAGLPQRARAERPRRMHATEGLGLGLRSGASPKVADSTAFDLTLTLTLTLTPSAGGGDIRPLLRRGAGARKGRRVRPEG